MVTDTEADLQAISESDAPLGDRAMLVLPTYNERGNLEEIVGRILASDPRMDVVIVDDSSPDGTGDLADRLAAADSRIRVMHRAGKLGLGSAYTAGFNLARELGYHIVGSLDADHSHDPASLCPMIAEIDRGADIVIGSRYVPGGRTVNWTLPRKINSWSANFLVRLVLGVRVRDCTSGFRMYRHSIFNRVPEDQLLGKGFDALVEILFRAHRLGLRVVEVPIVFRDRSNGQSKFGPREIANSLKTLQRLGLERLRRES